MKTRVIGYYILLVIFLYTGCDYSRQFTKKCFNFAQTGKIGVLPFDNRTENPHAGVIVTDLMTTELYSRHKFDIVSPLTIKQTLGENFELGATEILTAQSLKDLAKKCGADSFIVGSVTEYQYKKGLRDKPVVGIDAKLIIAESGEVVWACSLTREELSFLFYQGSVNLVAQKICRQMTDQIARNIR